MYDVLGVVACSILMYMVVRTPGNPGKPGIHLEFENSTWNTWKTWNSHEKS